MGLTAILFLVFFFGMSVLALVRHPMYGLYLYIAVFYLHPPTRWWGELLPDLRWSLLAGFVTLLGIFIKKIRQPRSVWAQGAAALFAAYVLYMWLQTPWAVDPEEHWLALSIYTKFLVLIYVIHSLVDTREKLAGFLLAHGLGCLYLGYLAWTIGTGDVSRLNGVGGPGIDDANTLAMQLATGVYAAAGFYFAERSRWRYVALLIVPFAINGIVLTGSRGGFLALLAGGVAFFFTRPRATLRALLPYAVAGLLLLGYLASETFLDRMSTIRTAVEEPEQMDGSAASRLVIIKAQWEMVKTHPLGAGHAGTTALSYQYIPSEYHSGQYGRSSHNTFMSALVDQGFLGFVAWIWIAALVWFAYRRARVAADRLGNQSLGWLVAGAAAVHVTVLTAGLFAPLIRQEVYIWVLALACCLANISAREPVAEKTRTLGGKRAPGSLKSA